MNDQPTLLVPVPLAQALVNYLARRPYAEVFELLAALQQCKPAASEAPSNGEPPA